MNDGSPPRAALSPQPIPASTPLTVILTAEKWNTVLAAIGEMPYRTAAPLISEIAQQLEDGAALATRAEPARGKAHAPS